MTETLGAGAREVARPDTAQATVPVVRFTVRGEPVSDATETTTAGSSGTDEGRPYVVVYDGHCKVCGRMVRALRRWDRRSRLLEILPSQWPGLAERFPAIAARDYAESLQLVRPSDGTRWQGAAAIEQLLGVLPRGRWVAWVFAVPFARTLADGFYRWFARNRYRLGCGDHCAYRPGG